MIRTILVLLFLVLYLIIGIPILIIEWVIKKINKRAADISTLRIVQWAFKVILFISGVKVTVKGAEHIPKDQPVLYIGNHRSYFDIIITYSRCPDLTGYISKDLLEKVPLLNIWMKRLYCLFLNRTDLKQGLKTILTGIEYVKQGVSMCIFPEGTRNTTDQPLLPFKAGSLKIADKTGCPIVPMALTNTADIMENHLPRIKPTHVILQYGEPIYPKELSKEDKKKLASITQQRVEALYLDNQSML